MMSCVVKETHKIEIESTEGINIEVGIVNRKIHYILLYKDGEKAIALAVPHDNSMMALFTLRGQLDAVIEEAKKHVSLVGPDD